MAESQLHRTLVWSIVTYMKTLPDCCDSLVEADLPDYDTRTTQVLNGYYPDVYYCDLSKTIIGEAKTENDIANQHTYNQLMSYADELAYSSGEKIMILAVPALAFATMCNIIVRLFGRDRARGIKIHILGLNAKREEIWV